MSPVNVSQKVVRSAVLISLVHVRASLRKHLWQGQLVRLQFSWDLVWKLVLKLFLNSRRPPGRELFGQLGQNSAGRDLGSYLVNFSELQSFLQRGKVHDCV